MSDYRLLEAGDPAPWFNQRSMANPNFAFDRVSGRFVVLCFYLSAADEGGRQMLSFLDDNRALFDDHLRVFFGVSIDPADLAERRIAESMPGIRHFLDHDFQISRLYGAAPVDGIVKAEDLRRFWMVLDPALRVHAGLHARPDGGEKEALAALLQSLPPVDAVAGFRVQAPVIVLPRVFEPDFCASLIDLYEKGGGRETGFMRDVGGKTVEVMDPVHKRRTDYTIEDPALIRLLQQKVLRRVVPEIRKVHQFEATRMERYLVACYDSEIGGHFRAHRDNTTKGTAHRRFAISINLNSDFEGGEVSFPEYGGQSCKPPTGGAVIFSCSLLHAVSKVTRGKRYAFLPFLYDEAAARIREANNRHLDQKLGEYKA